MKYAARCFRNMNTIEGRGRVGNFFIRLIFYKIFELIEKPERRLKCHFLASQIWKEEIRSLCDWLENAYVHRLRNWKPGNANV